MTNDEMWIAIAEDRGWKKCPDMENYWRQPDGRYCGGEYIPNYPEDLNAIIPLLPTGTYVEKHEGLWKIYIYGMIQVICRGKDLALTACEFYLRVKGLWK